MLTIWRGAQLFNRLAQLTSAYSNHLALRSFSCTSPTGKGTKLSEAEKRERQRVYSRQWEAKNPDAVRRMRRRYYEANKAAIIQKVTQYAQRTKALGASFAGEVKRKPPHERKIERDKRRAEVIAECERRRAALKAETVRRRAEQQAEREAQREQLRADREAESKSRLLRKQAAKKAESAKQRADKKAEREQRRAEQMTERQQRKASLAEERAILCTAKAEANRESARQKAAEYKLNPEFRKKMVADERRRRATKSGYARREDMRVWVLRCLRRAEFSWKTHVPIVYPQKVVKTCSACRKQRLSGARLWWKSLSYPDKDVFQCHSCYAADYRRAMPRGFEDFEFGQGKMPKP